MGLPIDRCHEPCPSVIPNTDQPRLHLRPLSPDPVLPTMLAQSRLLLPGVCHGGEARAASPDGRHHQSQLWWVCHPMVLLLGYSKITGGFRVIAPFTPPLLKYNCWYFIMTIGLEFSLELEI